jgi:hypothetical protein
VLRHQGLNSKDTSVNSTIKPVNITVNIIIRRGLQASILLGCMEWSGMRDSNPRHPAPKAGALPGCANPRMTLHTVFLKSAHDTDRAGYRQCEMITSSNKLGDFHSLVPLPV